MLGLFILIWIHLCPCMSFLDLRPWKRPHTVPRRETSLARQHRFVNRNCEIAKLRNFAFPNSQFVRVSFRSSALGLRSLGRENSKTQNPRPKTQDLRPGKAQLENNHSLCSHEISQFRISAIPQFFFTLTISISTRLFA